MSSYKVLPSHNESILDTRHSVRGETRPVWDVYTWLYYSHNTRHLNIWNIFGVSQSGWQNFPNEWKLILLNKTIWKFNHYANYKEYQLLCPDDTRSPEALQNYSKQLCVLCSVYFLFLILHLPFLIFSLSNVSKNVFYFIINLFNLSANKPVQDCPILSEKHLFVNLDTIPWSHQTLSSLLSIMIFNPSCTLKSSEKFSTKNGNAIFSN